MKKSPFKNLNKDALTKKAKRAGVSIEKYANTVLKNPSRYTESTRRQAQWYKNFVK